MTITAEVLQQGAILNLDKPYGWSSFDAIRFVQKEIRRRFALSKLKIGHAGTLDPLATGVLLLCTGKATRQIENLQNAEKEYLATIRLGAVTPSYDLETEPTKNLPCSHISIADIERVMQSFIGEQEQMPPAFSAKNIDGRRAYQIARSGGNIPLKSSRICIYSITIVSFEFPYLSVKVLCGKGTYIRTLASDAGARLGCGAYLAGLRRTVCGDYGEQMLHNIYDLFSDSII